MAKRPTKTVAAALARVTVARRVIEERSIDYAVGEHAEVWKAIADGGWRAVGSSGPKEDDPNRRVARVARVIEQD